MVEFDKEYWRDLVSINGKMDEDLVLNELHDFNFMLNEVPEVYCAVTNGLLSKPLYDASVVIREFEERHYDKGITQDDLQDMISDCEEYEELKEHLIQYFELKVIK